MGKVLSSQTSPDKTVLSDANSTFVCGQDPEGTGRNYTRAPSKLQVSKLTFSVYLFIFFNGELWWGYRSRGGWRRHDVTSWHRLQTLSRGGAVFSIAAQSSPWCARFLRGFVFVCSSWTFEFCSSLFALCDNLCLSLFHVSLFMRARALVHAHADVIKFSLSPPSSILSKFLVLHVVLLPLSYFLPSSPRGFIIINDAATVTYVTWEVTLGRGSIHHSVLNCSLLFSVAGVIILSQGKSWRVSAIPTHRKQVLLTRI